MKKFRPLVLFVSLWLFLPGISQQTAFYDDPEALYRRAEDLFEKEKYGPAGTLFDKVISLIPDEGSTLKSGAEYHKAICSYYMFHGDAGYQLLEYAETHPSDPGINEVYFYLGADAFRNRRYSSALKYFGEVKAPALPSGKRDEYFFKTGYAAFRMDKMGEARTNFRSVRDKKGKYGAPATYYSAHISYSEGMYQQALEDFSDLSDSPVFGQIVPYYIFQILFFQEKYAEVVTYGENLVETSTEKRTPEILRIMGESYYRMGNYVNAADYLGDFMESRSSAAGRTDHYQLGFALYKTQAYNKAIEHFQEVTGREDTLAQYAYYYLADCYLKTDRKKFALNAFLSAYKLPFDVEIKEDALFHHAQLAYELSFDPYSEAVRALRQYLAEYPNSSRNDEAYEFLYNIALATRNYKDALDALDNIRSKDTEHRKNYQKILYYRGIELFNQADFEEAVSHLKRSSEMDADKKIAAKSLFWIGEAFYRQGNYWSAEKYLTDFQQSPSSFGMPEYYLAYYDLGYIYYKKQEYGNSIIEFRKFAESDPGYPDLIADAGIRIADAYYVLRKYDNAIHWYDKAIATDRGETDYALFQKAISLGVLQRNEEKITTLNALISRYPRSPRITDALYELGNTYLITSRNEMALRSFKEITNDYPQSSNVGKAMLKTGLIYYNGGQNDLAIATFKKVVDRFPATPESKEALVSIRNIYVELNRVDEFFTYVQDLSFANITRAEQDSITFVAAENQYLQGTCEEAVPAFKNYLEKYPDGAYTSHANYYIGECHLRSDRNSDALDVFEKVIAGPRSKYTENALLKSARIAFRQGEYKDAFGYFYELEQLAEKASNLEEARYGQMKCNYLLKKYEVAASSASELLKAPKISDDRKIDALMIRAKSYIALNEPGQASEDFRGIIDTKYGPYAAEAKYNLAGISYIQGDLAEAEKQVFELINQYAAFDYWVASGFILLADIYVQTGNTYQARQTLESIIANHEGPELKEVASQKLQAVKEMEAQNSGQEQIKKDTVPEEGVNITIEGNDKN